MCCFWVSSWPVWNRPCWNWCFQALAGTNEIKNLKFLITGSSVFDINIVPLGPSILSGSKAAKRNCAQLNFGVLVLPWWMRTYTTLVDCVAWQVLCSERLTTRMVETSMNKLFQVRACSDCKIPRLPHGHGCESSQLRAEAIWLAWKSLTCVWEWSSGNWVLGTRLWHFQAVFQLSGGNNWTFALTVPAVRLGTQTEMQN